MSRFSFALLLLSTLWGGETLGQVNENFESGAITSWAQSPANRWTASTDRPISGVYSLKHTYDNSLADADFVGLDMNLSNISEGSVKWRFLLKHGYAPSASNRWSVFLMSSANANEIKSGILFNGYSVGINTTGSDDKLRIYKHYNILSTQVTEILLETTFNWETEVGTSKAAAFEIERSASGAWTLKVSKDGLFANLVTLGTFENSDFGTMQNFVVAYSYTSSADRNLWLDDISITYTPLNSNNRTSTAMLPSVQVAPHQLFTTDTSESQAKELLRFKIGDKGDGDGLPTKPTHLKFQTSTASPNLSLLFENVYLKTESSSIPIKSSNISESSIEIDLDEGNLQVEDGTEKELSLWTTINKAASVLDHASVGVEIPTSNHGWIAAVSGSGFASTFPAAVGIGHTVEVVARKLSVAEQPSSVQKGRVFSVSINATDYNANKDIDYNGTATLSLYTGGGNLTIPQGATQNLSTGVATWDNLTYSGSDSFSLKVTNSSLGEIITQPIAVSNDSTSTITLTTTQPEAKAMTPGCESTTCAVEMMRIQATDAGGDGVPTIVTQIKLTNAATSGAADWTKAVRFFSIKVNGREISLGNPTITKTSATIPILPGDLLISEGESVEISILVGLKDLVTDGELLQIMVDAPNHGFTTAANGSAFGATLLQPLTSPSFPINVAANKLSWKKIPTVVAVNENFDIEANAVDIFGNLDFSYTGLATLSFTNTKGAITPFTTNATGGKAVFSGNSLSHSGEYRVSAASGSISETPIATLLVGDKNSTITASANTIPSGTLFSNKNTFIPILSVDIRDLGTTDTLPTIITKATLKIITSDTLANASPVSEVVVKMEDGTTVATSTDLLTENTIEVRFTNGFSVANNSSRNLIFYASSSHYPVTDNTVIQFKIPAKDCGWSVGSNSTLLLQILPYDILSPQLTTQVEATVIKPKVKPIISISELPTLTALATDSLSNIDTDCALNINAAIVNTSTGEKRTYSGSFAKGKAIFNLAETLAPGTYKGEFTTDFLPAAQFVFDVSPIKTCIVNEDFESGILPISWLGINDWKIDQSSALGSSKSIRHNGLPGASISTLTIPCDANLQTDSYAFSITLKTGNWAPSSDNRFIILLSSISNIDSDTMNGYAIGVNQSGDDDIVKVWQITDGKAVKVLLTTTFVWKENSTATFSLSMLPNGNRTLSINGTDYSFRDLLLSKIGCFGLKYNYTSTRAGLLWADDISMCRFACGPKLISVNRFESKKIMLKFSEPIIETSNLTANIHLWNNGSPIQPASVVNESGAILFTATTELPQKATLAWKNLTDSEGNASSDSLAVEFGPTIEFGSIVFNEIMADPTPVVGLPECEYLELYSRSVDSLNLDGWTLQSGSSITTLHNIAVKPHQYILLTTSTCATQSMLADNGAIGVTSFPSLTNGGATLTLKDPAGATITQVAYSDDWYRNTPKKEGGYSLEKVDTENLSEDSLNWKGSSDISGGTPGKANSVMEANPDITAPSIIGIKVINKTTLSLYFSEPLQPLTITAEKFTVESSLGGVTCIKTAIPTRQIDLTFGMEMTLNTIYMLTISNTITDLSGNSLTVAKVPFAITELPKWQDIVINELLFNTFAGGADFIEIYNRATLPFNLSHLKLFRRDDNGALTSEIRLSNYDRLIAPGEYVAFTPNPENIKQLYSCSNPSNLLKLDIPAMNDDQGTVVLTDTLGERADEVTYTDKMHYALLASTEGVSLERVNPDILSDKASSWQSASQLSGFATPTTKNSCYREFEEVGSRVTIDPDLFSPDGDGYHDVTYIRLKLPEAGWNASITIYDSKGREVRKLLSNALVDVDGEIVWDGLTNDNRLAEMGIYVVLVEMFHLSGETHKEKKVVVVGGRL